MATLADAPGECCVKTVQHTGTARGEVVVIADVPTYVVSPPGTNYNASTPFKKILLFYSDVYGPLYINSQLVMDYFAAQGLSFWAYKSNQRCAHDAHWQRAAART